KALLSLLDALGRGGAAALPLCPGDGVTGEDAFRPLAARGGGRGVGIRVMDPPAPSAAGWSLKAPAEAGAFLDRLAVWLAEG
ncbi:trehalose-phosphatase, partial [Azospirillum brasilense]|nr:trehalose-phosphatase [Azospirillum brasilense]